jgi:hypothetical protein
LDVITPIVAAHGKRLAGRPRAANGYPNLRVNSWEARSQYASGPLLLECL